MNMTECRIQIWYNKTSKARKTAAPFAENVKCAHFQTATWLLTMSPDPPDGREEVNRLLSPIGIPAGIPPAPLEVLKLVKCTCSLYSYVLLPWRYKDLLQGSN